MGRAPFQNKEVAAVLHWAVSSQYRSRAVQLSPMPPSPQARLRTLAWYDGQTNITYTVTGWLFDNGAG